MNANVGVLSGIRVLDFGRFIAGPYCATLLGEFGADVIRVEKPGGAEDRALSPVAAEGDGALFMQMGRNKRSLTLDLTSPKGRAIAHRLVKTADIVVVNMPHASLAPLGLDYASLKAAKDDIILVNVSAYGNRGPWRDRPGFDSVGQALSGTAHLSGEPGRPYRAQVNWVDYGTAAHAALGAMLALMERQKTGRGQEVGASLLATAVSFQNPILIDQMMLNTNRGGLGNRSHASGPTDMFRVKDGWIVCQVVGNAIFRRWARLMNEEERWLGDPRFATDQLRGDNGAILSERMAQWCAERTREEALNELAAAKIPSAPVLSTQEVINHPQVDALGLLTPAPGETTKARLARVPIELCETPGEINSAAPAPGQHTDEILSGLGLSEPEIAALREDNIV